MAAFTLLRSKFLTTNQASEHTDFTDDAAVDALFHCDNSGSDGRTCIDLGC